MTLFDPKESGPRREAASNKSATTPNTPKSSRPPRQTQYERVFAALLRSDEVCGSELYAMFIPRFSVHIHKMRKTGIVISKRLCDRHDHEGTQWLYRLEALPYNPRVN